MKALKRITALILAMLVLFSFCITQISASNIFYEWVGPVDIYYFDPPDDGSFAKVSGTVLAWNEDTYTDFLAVTRVHRDIEGDYLVHHINLLRHAANAACSSFKKVMI